VRHVILENLGWRIIRLWSTDYFQDPDEVISQIDSRLKGILDEGRSNAGFSEKAKAHKEAQVQLGAETECYEPPSDKIDVNSISSSQISANSLNPLLVGEYDHTKYFNEDYKTTLTRIAKEILSEKNGITLHELALDIANLHGLTRTSKKQRCHLIDIIKPWAGLRRDGVHKPVVWSKPDDVVEEISWRGLDVFGDDRDWSEIPYPEAKGLARLALQQSPSDPVDFICNIFKLQRRHEKTLAEFQAWVDDVAMVDE